MLWQVSNSLDNICFLYKYQITYKKKKHLKSVLNNYDYFKNKKKYFRIFKDIVQKRKKNYLQANCNYVKNLNFRKKKHKKRYKNKYLSRKINWKTFKFSPIYQKIKLLIYKRKKLKKSRLRFTPIIIRKRSFSNVQRRVKVLKWLFLNNKKRKKLKIRFRKWRRRLGRVQIRKEKYSILKKFLFKHKYYNWGLKKKLLKKYKQPKRRYKISGKNPKLKFLSKKMFKMLKKTRVRLHIRKYFSYKKRRKFVSLWDLKLRKNILKLKKRLFFKKKRILKKKFEKRFGKKFGKNTGKEFERRFSKKYQARFKEMFVKKKKKVIKTKIRVMKRFKRRIIKRLIKLKLQAILDKNLISKRKKRFLTKLLIRLKKKKRKVIKKKIKKVKKVVFKKSFFKKARLKFKRFKKKKIRNYKYYYKCRYKRSMHKYQHLIFYYLRSQKRLIKFLQKHNLRVSTLYKNKFKKKSQKKRRIIRIYFKRYLKKKKKKISKRTYQIKNMVKAIKIFDNNKFYRIFFWKQLNLSPKYNLFSKYKKLLKRKRMLLKKKKKSPRLTKRYKLFRKTKLRKKKVFYFFLTRRIPKIIKKKKKKKFFKALKKVLRIRNKIKFIKERSNNSKNSTYVYVLKKITLSFQKIKENININNFLWLNNKLFESYLLKFYFYKNKLIKKLSMKKKKKKTFFFNFRNKKLKTYRNARATHWNFFTHKTLKERRYQNFLDVFLKKQKSYFYHIFTFFAFKFRLSYKFWTNFNFLYQTFYLIDKLKKKIYQLPVHYDFWYFIKKYEFSKTKITTKVKFWQSKRMKIKRTFWMQQKKKIPKYIKNKIFEILGITNCIQYDFITNYFAILKQHNHTTHTNLFVFKNKYLKLHGFKYNS